MTTNTRFIILASLLFAAAALIFVDIPVRAHGESNGENLIILLAERVDELFGRVETLEAIYDGPGAQDRDEGRTCLLAETGEFGGSTLQNESIVKFVGEFDQVPTEHRLVSARVEKESGQILVLYVARHADGWAYVFEGWNGCEFNGSSDWKPAEG